MGRNFDNEIAGETLCVEVWFLVVILLIGIGKK